MVQGLELRVESAGLRFEGQGWRVPPLRSSALPPPLPAFLASTAPHKIEFICLIANSLLRKHRHLSGKIVRVGVTPPLGMPQHQPPGIPRGPASGCECGTHKTGRPDSSLGFEANIPMTFEKTFVLSSLGMLGGTCRRPRSQSVSPSPASVSG